MTDWPVKTLDALCDEGVVLLGRGDVISKRDIAANPGPYPIYSSARENEGKFGEYGDYMFDEEMITWSIDGGGRLFYRSKHKFSVTNVGGTLRVLKPKILEIRYLHGALEDLHSRKVFDWVFKAHPSVIRKVYDKIPVPPLEEQKRIVVLLDAATARVTELTACYEQARTHAKNLFTSALRDALESNPDWPVKNLGEVCELVSRGRPPSYCEVGGVIVLNQKCVRNGQIDFGPSRRTDHISKLIPEWAYVREGDTLINSTGAGTLGRASFVSMLTEPTTFDTHLTVVRPRREICWPAFVGLVLNGREKDIVDLAGGATGQTELPREAVRSFEIPMPPLEEQKQIVVRLDSIRAKTSEMVAAYDAKLQAAKDLRQSVLEAAFAGEL
jgi:type I restriction enzyme S subunit